MEQGEEGKTVRYTLSKGPEYEYHVPAKGEGSRIAYASCAGFHDPKDMLKVESRQVTVPDFTLTGSILTVPPTKVASSRRKVSSLYHWLYVLRSATSVRASGAGKESLEKPCRHISVNVASSIPSNTVGGPISRST